jgi:cytoskeletal protein CcmA (bactofilin family)
MWFSKRKAPPIRSLVGEGTVLHGNLGFADGLRIDGEVHGDVVATTAAACWSSAKKPASMAR